MLARIEWSTTHDFGFTRAKMVASGCSPTTAAGYVRNRAGGRADVSVALFQNLPPGWQRRLAGVLRQNSEELLALAGTLSAL